MGQVKTVGKHKTSVYSRETNGRKYTIIKYHKTEVVLFSDKAILLDSGGWRTVTTKTRMNQASYQYGLGYYVYQKDFEWYVDFQGKTIPFSDGMCLAR